MSDRDAQATPAATDSPARWRVCAAELDERAARLTVDGKTIALDRSGYDLLLFLLRNAGRVVGKEELLRVGWPGRVVSENSLAKAMGRLRVALNDPQGECLRVVHGYGYRVVGPVECVHESSEHDRIVIASEPESAPVASAAAEVTASRRPRTLAAIGTLVALVLLALLAAIRLGPPVPAAAATGTPASTAPAPPSIAVLPFVDLSPKQDQAHFSDGLADQLLDALSRLPQLHVVARTSSFAYRDKAADIQTIGRALNAATVLEGSVRRSGDRIRVTVQLIGTANGYHLWSETYDRPITELFAMQDEIVRAIVGALRIELLPEQLQGLVRHGTRNPEAYAQFLLAKTRYQDDETSGRRTIAAFERAVELDPGFYEAWLGLADILGHSGMYADGAEQALAGKHRAMAAVNHAIALDPKRPDGYLLRGDLRYAHHWDWYGAEEDLERAAALGARNSVGYLLRVCRLKAALGRLPQAIALARRATEVDSGSTPWTVMGYHYTALGEFDKAREALAQSVRITPLDEHAHYYLGLGALLEGRPTQSLQHFEDSAHFLRLTGLAIAHHSLGDAAASDRNLQALISRFGHITPYQAADVYAWRGETDNAFKWLERAYELRDASFMYLKFDPLLRNLHSDPRWRELLMKVGLPV